MRRIHLVHWNAAEAEEKASRLSAAGYEVAWETLTPAALRELRNNPPDAVVIVLARLPSQGRDIALAIRHYKTTRNVPLVFVDGEPEKVARIREQVPDAAYTTWSQLNGSIEQAIAHPPQIPATPRSLLDGYAGRPLPTKLGIKPNLSIALCDAPPDFRAAIGPLPEGARLSEDATGCYDMIICFIRSLEELERRIGQMAARDDFRSLWIAWPKKASGVSTDLSQQIVREAGLATGLVDYKICAIDATWSGLLFTRRKAKRGLPDL